MSSVLLEARSYRPFKSSEEYLYAMREDLAEWLNTMYPELHINVGNFMDRLDTGVTLCKHANNVRQAAEEYIMRRHARNKSMTKSITSGLAGPVLSMGNVHFLPAAKSGTFFARDNVSNFITWCRKSLQIFECLLFETDDLIMRKNEKHVILCLLEVARRGAKFGMLAPMLVQMERQIDREIAADNRANGVSNSVKHDSNTTEADIDLFESESEDEDDTSRPMLMYGPQQQIVTNDLKSLDEMVRDLVEKCTCPSQFPMIRVSEGKYRIGDTKVLIFVRILRSHVMVRVGGGWDTLAHYLDKHDPCRCKTQHRTSVAARLITKPSQLNNGVGLHKAQVVYERLSVPTWKQLGNVQQGTPIPEGQNGTLSTPVRTRSRSRSPAQRKNNHNIHYVKNAGHERGSLLASPIFSRRSPSPSPRRFEVHDKGSHLASPNLARRSPSPSPRRLDVKKKQNSLEQVYGPQNKICSHPNQAAVHFDCDHSGSTMRDTKIDSQAEDKYNKYDNISDNGSEISDEGYRSLGIVHSQGTQKRIALSILNRDTDDKSYADQTSVELQISNTDRNTSKMNGGDVGNFDQIPSESRDTEESAERSNVFAPLQAPDNGFLESGISVTDHEITVNIYDTDDVTGVESPIAHNDDCTVSNNITRTEVLDPTESFRRKNMENISTLAVGKLSPSNRKIPIFRSLRKNHQTAEDSDWSGNDSKQVPTVSADNHITKQNLAEKISSHGSPSGSTLYDKETSKLKPLRKLPVPNKQIHSSTLAQQLIEAAASAQNDSQIIYKMKELLSKYSNSSPKSGTAEVEGDLYNDFTTEWVENNGSIKHNTSHAVNSQSQEDTTASLIPEEVSCKETLPEISPRRDKGLSKIPAPVRSNTGLF